MRYARLFGRTLREIPADVQNPAMQILIRAGYVRARADGALHLLPLGVTMLDRLKMTFWKPCLDAGMQSVALTSGSQLPDEVGELLRGEVHSYRHLPVRLALPVRFRREAARSRFGMYEGREGEALHLVSLEREFAGEDAPLVSIREAWQKAFQELGLTVREAQSGGTEAWCGQDVEARALVCLTPSGADLFLACPACGTLAHELSARMAARGNSIEAPAPLEKVHTPACKTIQELAQFLHVAENQTAKAVFLVASYLNKVGEPPQDIFVFAVIRGDLDIHEGKLARLLGGAALRPATDGEIRAAGAVPGFASPVHLRAAAENALPVRIIVDESIPATANLVAGANEEDMHLRNVNYGRDFQADLVGDIAVARAGDACPHCGAGLVEETGVELAWFSRWKKSEIPCEVQGENGEKLALRADLASLEWERVFACVAEFNRDEQGLILPKMAAPYQVHLIALNDKKDPTPLERSESYYADLLEAGVDVLFDERDERPGVKFMDADLVGLPLRLTISARSLAAGGIEVKERGRTDKEIMAWKDVLEMCTKKGGAGGV